MATTKHSRRRGKATRTRSSRPTDWLLFLEPLLPEIEAAVEILRRLRWAVELSKRGLAEAPGPLPGWRNPYRPRIKSGLVESVLMPEEMVATLKPLDLRSLCDVWESEVREWAQAIWERRGDTLRLREKRQSYREAIDDLRSGPPQFGDPTITDAAGARLVNQLRAEPGRMFKLRTGAGIMHAHSFTDPFGNALPTDEEERLLKETEEERAERPEDDRALRRLVKGEHKKSRGGVRDIDSRLLRPKK